jgi:transcriptional regulator with XRE-family HTH domain
VIGVKDRIAQVRKQAGINQTDFAEKLNLTKNYISLIENGNRIPSDRTITDICREFNVNEVWLRTGEGEPFQEESRQEQIMKFAAQTIKGSDEFRKQFVSMLAKLDVEDWEALAKIFTKLANEAKK